ncbi:MAG: hypothetical protein VX737_00595 [Pseudomonadota bacterium]|nr:hypothetical protein [Pseudomonadota bacterium]
MSTTPVQSASQQTPVSSASLVPSSKETSSKKKREREDVRALLQEGLSPSKKSKRPKSFTPAQTRSKTLKIQEARCASKDVSSLFPDNIFPEMQKFKKDGGSKIEIRIIGLFYTEQGLEFKTLLEFAEENKKCFMTKFDGKSDALTRSPLKMHIEEIIALDENLDEIHVALQPLLDSPDLKRTCMGLRVVMSEQPCGTKERRCVYSVVEKFPEIFRFNEWALSSDQIHVVSQSASGDESGWVSYKELNEVIESEKSSRRASRKPSRNASRNKDSCNHRLYSLASIEWMEHDLDFREQGLIPWDDILDIHTNQQQAQVFTP